jgi:predicted GH43/DUF377 family glycosyl hydrolase
MIKVKKEGIILEKRDVEFENAGVLNPAIIKEGDSVHIFYRAVSTGNHSTIGYARLDGPLHVAERWDQPFISPEQIEKLIERRDDFGIDRKLGM